MTNDVLPRVSSAFIGRRAELEHIARLLIDPACHLLTLVGPGGIGKTSLALEAAKAQVKAFPNGVHVVALQPLSSPDAIVPAIAEAIVFQFYAGSEPRQQLFDYLREKSLLLVLDNFEHLLDAAPLVSDLLSHAPAVKVLVTSRERLNLREEWVFDVQGLPFPNTESQNDVEEYDAVQLFVQKARHAQANFTLTDERKPAVSRICQLVGGMPLAIELAAVWVRALPCQQIAAEIERSLDILETPARNVPSRHRNMRAAFEPTWKRLSENEQAVFKKLSVFRGNFTREAAQYVSGATPQTLLSLVDKSLLQVDANGYYKLHELLRQYAQEQLDAHPAERQRTHDLHSAYYAEFMGQRSSHMKGSRQSEAHREIEAELDNVRAAWEWSVLQSNAQEVEKFLWSLHFSFHTRFRFLEGQESFAKAAQAFESGTLDIEKERVLGQVYAYEGFFSIRLSLYEKAHQTLHKSLAILRRLECEQELAFTLYCVGTVYCYLGEYTDSDNCLRQAMAIYRALDLSWELAMALQGLSLTALRLGQSERAKQLAQECVTLFRGNSAFEAHGLRVLGEALYQMEDYHKAKYTLQECLSKVADNPVMMRYALAGLGKVCTGLHEDEEASTYFHQAFQAFGEIGFVRLLLETFVYLIPLLLRRGDSLRSVVLLAYVVHHSASDRETKDLAQAHLRQLEADLPPEAFASHYEKGRTSTRDAVIALLYRHPLFARFLKSDNRPAKTTVTSSTLLTERELEILHLMAEGMSNREIAEKLILSVGTVKWYGSQICSKLHVQNRVQAIARGRELKLLA